ncbi:unnamed protein product [Arctia plantaginis]|uniref:unspecific monooxygenase n=1 Tax=Arctia plantaginis TaxID=874455 RepID=A0A8S1B7B4_ARCPL|nr:unnamed protein product [Arctia plantaginis]
MGSLTFLQKQNPAYWMRQAYNDFKSPYLGMWLFWRPALVINSPEIIKRILVKDSDNFRNRFMSSGKTDPMGSMSILLIKDPAWTSLRRRLTPIFSAAKLKKHYKIVQVKSTDFIQRIKELSAKKIYFNLRTLSADYTTDVIGESAFGMVSESAKTGDSLMRGIAREFMAFNIQRGLSWSSIFFLPEVVDIFRFSFLPKDTLRRLRIIFRSIVEQRGGFDKKIDEPQDLLDALLKIKQEADEDGEEISEDFLLAQASVFLLAGFDTSGSAMSWVLYTLAWHPHCQEKIYEEIIAVKNKHGVQDLDANTLSELVYLNCVIKETLRLFPPMGWLDRVATKDYKIDEKVTIPAGTPVYLNAVATQMDPQYFPDPLVFNPDRFMPENERNITPFTYLPFGEGPRSCIGTRFAFQALKQPIASIILTFKIETLPDTPSPIDVQVENHGLFLMPLDENMKVKFVPRDLE